MFFVYAIYNNLHDKIYVGQTTNLDERIRLHNNHTFSKSYTARFDGKWVLIYSEEIEDKEFALKREKQLKSYRGREFVRKFVSK